MSDLPAIPEAMQAWPGEGWISWQEWQAAEDDPFVRAYDLAGFDGKQWAVLPECSFWARRGLWYGPGGVELVGFRITHLRLHMHEPYDAR